MLKWYTARRLQSQLLLWTALIVTVSVVGILEIAVRSNIRMLEGNLRSRSENGIGSVTRFLQLATASKPEASTVSLLGPELRERVAADYTMIRLDIVQRQGDDIVIAASSSDKDDVLVRNFVQTPVTEVRRFDDGRAMITSQAVENSDYGIVAVASMENIDRYAEFNRRSIFVIATILIIVVVTLMHFMYKRIVSKRLGELLDGIHRAKSGYAARIPENRQDEIGIIAKTLNGLIAQAQSFNEELRRQVESATADLNQRNKILQETTRQMEETTRQMVELQKQLLDSERLAAVGQLAATFAHEIGSPMTSLSAHVQLLLEDSRLSEDQREALTIVLEQIQATVQIVNEMLKSARRGPADFVLTDLNAILRNVLHLVRPKLMSQKIDLQVNLDRLPLVRGYPLYLQEVFLNIINNASDAMPNGGQLDVTSWFDRDKELVNVRITDSGPGIDERVLKNVLDHFVTTKAIGRGTGLGLGIVKEIVDSHRGTFQIGSGDGKGTAAHITFPVEATAVLAS
jgi:two-component system NtrC family sensor kinase